MFTILSVLCTLNSVLSFSLQVSNQHLLISIKSLPRLVKHSARRAIKAALWQALDFLLPWVHNSGEGG